MKPLIGPTTRRPTPSHSEHPVGGTKKDVIITARIYTEFCPPRITAGRHLWLV